MIEELLEKHKNLKEVRVGMCLPDGRASNFTDIRSKAEVFVDNYLKAKEGFIKYNVRISSSHLSLNPRPYYCGYVFNSGSCIDANGHILPCTQKIRVEKYGIGSVGDINVNINNERLFYDEWYEPMLKCCSSCFAYYYCSGGCPVDMKRHSDGSYQDDECYSLCALTKHFFSNIIQRIVKDDPPKWIATQPLHNYSSSSITVVSYREK